jgi:hypothetical protein
MAGLCEKLAIRWSDDGGKSLRKSERSLHSSAAQVTIGFERAAFAVKIQDIENNSANSIQEWKVNDISSTGMGLTFVGKSVEQLAIGRIVLVKTESHPLLLGAIRRILRQQNGTRVGIEILGQNPVGVSLSEPVVIVTSPPLPSTLPNNSRKGQRWFLMPKPLAEPGREQILTQGVSLI